MLLWSRLLGSEANENVFGGTRCQRASCSGPCRPVLSQSGQTASKKKVCPKLWNLVLVARLNDAHGLFRSHVARFDKAYFLQILDLAYVCICDVYMAKAWTNKLL
jgi:hypothetical protein